jgi:hypothetical protein
MAGQDASDPQVTFDQAGHPYYAWLRLDPSTGNEVVQALLPPPPPGPPPPPPPVGCNPCRLSVLHVSPHTFATAGRRVRGHCVAVTRANARRPRCRRSIALRISFNLPADAVVRLTVVKLTAGRLVARRCVTPTRHNRKRPHCRRSSPVAGAITFQGRAGANSFVFRGRIGGRRLRPGAYKLIATPVVTGQAPPAVSTTFTIVGVRPSRPAR